MSGSGGGRDADMFSTPEMSVLLGVGAIALLIYMVYSVHHATINGVIVAVNQALLYPFAFFSASAAKAHHAISQRDPAHFTWANIQAQLTLTGRYLLWVSWA